MRGQRTRISRVHRPTRKGRPLPEGLTWYASKRARDKATRDAADGKMTDLYSSEASRPVPSSVHANVYSATEEGVGMLPCSLAAL